MLIENQTIKTIERALIKEMQNGKTKEEALMLMLQRASQTVVNLRAELWECEQC